MLECAKHVCDVVTNFAFWSRFLNRVDPLVAQISANKKLKTDRNIDMCTNNSRGIEIRETSGATHEHTSLQRHSRRKSVCSPTYRGVRPAIHRTRDA